jgi:hypothetical protein
MMPSDEYLLRVPHPIAYRIGEVVYLKTDPNQYRRLVVGYIVRPHAVTYVVACMNAETVHLEVELSPRIDTLYRLDLHERGDEDMNTN